MAIRGSVHWFGWLVDTYNCMDLLISMYMVRCEAVLVVVMAVVIVFLYSMIDLVLRLNTI